MEQKMILVVDAQGGGMGAQLVKRLKPRLPKDCTLLCAGTNVLATSAMLKAGAEQGATGENAIIYNVSRARVVLGPIGIILANGILGEVSPAIAGAVSGSPAKKVLIPSNHCSVSVAGTTDKKLDEYFEDAVALTLKTLEAE